MPTAVSMVGGGGEPSFSPHWGSAWLEARVPHLSWLTGCSITLSDGARPLLVQRDAQADRGVYSNSSFFGDGVIEPDENVGPIVLAASGTLGAGRVVVVGDGTVFTNFGTFQFSRYELLECLIALANARGSGPATLWWLALAAAGASCLLALTLAAGVGRALIIITAAAVATAGCFVGDGLAAQMELRPRPVTHQPIVAFLGSHADYFLAPTIGAPRRDVGESYDTLFVEIARYGLRPRFVGDLATAMSESRVIVVPAVFPAFTPDELAQLNAWICDGGVLWLLSDEREVTVRGMQQVAGSVGRSDAADAVPDDADGGAGWTDSRVEGCKAIVREIVIDKGLLVLTWQGQELSRKAMGHCFPEPTPDRAPRFQLVERVMRTLQGRTGCTDAERFTVRTTSSTAASSK